MWDIGRRQEKFVTHEEVSHVDYYNKQQNVQSIAVMK